jgi:hypothetical protein
VDTPERDAEIAKRAYAIWELEGQPNGRDLDHWLRAESEIDTARRPPLAKNGPARKRRSRGQAP